MIHGGSMSIGCRAIGDQAAEELFLLAADAGWENAVSLHFFEVARFPGAVEGCLLRAVDAEVGEPAFARERLDPLPFLARKAFGPKYRSVDFSLAWSFNSNSERSAAFP